MANDPRRDPRAQRAAQLMRRETRELYLALELEEEPEPEEESYDVGDDGDVVISAAMGRFFADEPQETTIPVEEWNEQHPLWLAFKKGDVKIVQGADGRDVMVTRDAYVRARGNDLFPTQDYSKADQAILDQAASLAQIKYELAKTLIAYASADFPIQGTTTIEGTTFALSPLLQKAEQVSNAVPPVGGAVLCATLDFGHKGGSRQVIFDLPPTQIVRAPFAGSFGKLSARLWPQYYTHNDDGLVAGVRVYLLSPNGPILTTELWNSIPSNLMAENFFTNPFGAPCVGWFAEGFQQNDQPSRPTRRFYGSVKVTGVVAAQPTRCPVANGATYVQLVGGIYDSANPTLQSLQFLQNLAPTSNVPLPQVGPFNVGDMVPLDSKVQSIDVINSPNAAVAIHDIPFELVYYIGL